MLFGTNEIKLQSLSGLLGSARPSSQTNKRFRTGQNFPLLDSVSSFSFRFLLPQTRSAPNNQRAPAARSRTTLVSFPNKFLSLLLDS